MMQNTAEDSDVNIKIKNIGGISEADVRLDSGVNILSGPNATNRTSFLKALAAAQGSKNVSLKGDKSEAKVELTLNDTTYQRTIYDKGDSLVFEGSCPLTESEAELADLFAFLFERNRARSAIRQGEDLRNVVMDPVDTDDIHREIESLKNEREQKRDRIEEIRSTQQKLPNLKQRRDELSGEISDLEEALSSKRAELEEGDADVGENKKQKEELENKVNRLRSKESELENIESKIERTTQTISHLEDDLDAAEKDLADLSAVDSDELDDIKSELDRLHDRLARKESMMSELQNVIQFNKDVIEEDGLEDGTFSKLASGNNETESGDTVTEELFDDSDEIICWTCGTATTRSQIAGTIEQLQGVHEDLYGERENIQEQIQQRQSRKQELQEAQQRESALESSVEEISDELDQSRETLETLREKKDTLNDQIDELNDDIEKLRNEREDEVLSLHQEVNTLEFDLQEAKDKHESTVNEIEEIEAEAEKIDTLEAEITQLEDQIEELKQRVDSLERQAVEEFNRHMESVLGILGYDNIERVWIERREVESRQGRRQVTEKQFELHVIRESEDGTTYEDTIEHLSESEREVTGLVFALAGYLAHEVYESTPFMILDSLEAIDSDRIASLLDYLSDYADNLAVALLPEDAQALPDNYNRVAEI